jgi:hypothetical protein
MTRRVMLDIETLGKRVGSVFFSIGAVEFTGGILGREFSALIDPRDAQSHGLTIDADTVGWWLQQSAEAQLEASLAWVTGDRMEPTLTRLAIWLEECWGNLEIWGNAPSLDCALVEEGYRVLGKKSPWSYAEERCYRTLKNLRRDVVMERTGTHHVALEDARSQARHAIALLEAAGCADWKLGLVPIEEEVA